MAEIQLLKEQIEQLKLMIENGNQNISFPQIPLPQPVEIKSGDIVENFKLFKNKWQLYLQATGLLTQNEEKKKAILLTAIGNDVYKRYQNMQITEIEQATSDSLLEAIEKNLAPSINKRFVRAIFNMAKQDDDESYDEYFNRLRTMIKNTQYGDLQNDLLLDKIICSIKDHSIREKLWLDKDITLEKAIEICRSKEISNKQLKSLDGNSMKINKLQRTFNYHQQQGQNFGAPAINTGFGTFNNTATSSPFSQFAFAKPATSGFDAVPTFGAQQASPSLFGSNAAQPQASGLLGGASTSTAFVSTTKTQPAFGNSSQPQKNNSIFGAAQPQANTSSLSGQPAATSAFGADVKPKAKH